MALKNPKIGINGLGRIGYCVTLDAVSRGLNVAVLNASRTGKEVADYLSRDSVHGRANFEITYGDKIQITKAREPENIPWGEYGVEYVIDCTGKFTKLEDASKHLTAGAKKVLLSSPVKEEPSELPMYVYGVNHTNYDGTFDVVSGASCTTNCLAPIAKVLNDNFGIEFGLMSTIHALTGKQPSVDKYDNKDDRIARGSHNIIPTSTGAAKAIGKVIPELKGKLDGNAYRVPVEDGSIVDLVVCLEKSTSYKEVCEVIRHAAENEMKGVIQYCTDHLVSQDVIGERVTSIFDVDAGKPLTDKFMKLAIWYDNEFGYTNQLLNLLEYMIKVDNK